jgi:arylsulfatase A-like enzyme
MKYTDGGMKKIKLFIILAAVIIPAVCFGYWIFGNYPKLFSNQEKITALCPDCNVVLIDLDVLRADDLPCYGYSRNTAPNLCGFAKDSWLYLNNYSQSFWTLPSMISIVTSMLPSVHNIRTDTGDTLPLYLKTLAETLKNTGYRTYYFGPTNNAELNENNGGLRGYDEIIPHNENMWQIKLEAASKIKRPFFMHLYASTAHLPYLIDRNEKLIADLSKPSGLPLYRDEFQDIYRKYLTGHLREIFKPETIKNHPEIFAISEPDRSWKIADYFDYLNSIADRDNRLVGWDVYYNAYLQNIDFKDATQAAYLRMLYDTKIRNLDQGKQAFFEFLADFSDQTNTVIIIESDHGEEFGEHGQFSHQSSPYNELYRTPLIIRIPGQIPKTVKTISQNLDIFPTILDIIGKPIPLELQGQSLVSANYLKNTVKNRYAFGISANSMTVQDLNWKIIFSSSKPAKSVEIYNLAEDPGEKNMLTGQEYENIVTEFNRTVNLLKDSYQQLKSYKSPDLLENQRILIKEGYF